MKALYYDRFQGPITLKNLPIPKITARQSLIQVKASGLCRSDWHGWMGHDADIVLPHVPGHELAGEVAAVGDEVKQFKVGDRVTIPFVSGCGKCKVCSSGNPQICDHQSQPGFTHWGSFAEYVRVDYSDENLVHLPDKIPFETAAALGCRFITAYRGIVSLGEISDQKTIAIFGCGGVGLSAILIAKSFSANVIAIDIRQDALDLASALGADRTILAKKKEDVYKKIRRMTDGGVTLSVDAIGSSSVARQSILSLAKRGKHIQIGLMAGKDADPRIPMSVVIARELEIIGSHGMAASAYPAMLSRISAGIISPDRLITKTIRLNEARDIIPRMGAQPETGITVINRF